MSGVTNVFVVEDHTRSREDDHQATRPAMWTTAYLSQGRAMSAVEHWARKAARPIRWKEISFGVSAVDAEKGSVMYNVLTFGVKQDGDPDE